MDHAKIRKEELICGQKSGQKGEMHMPRRGDNIRKRTDGRWEGRYPVTSADGKKRYLSVYGKSYREVKEKLTAKMYLLSNRESPAVIINNSFRDNL